MFRSGLSLLVLLGLATLGGCGSVNTLVRDDASAAHDLRLKATACTSLPRVYSGVSYTFCRLNVKTGRRWRRRKPTASSRCWPSTSRCPG